MRRRSKVILLTAMLLLLIAGGFSLYRYTRVMPAFHNKQPAYAPESTVGNLTDSMGASAPVAVQQQVAVDAPSVASPDPAQPTNLAPSLGTSAAAPSASRATPTPQGSATAIANTLQAVTGAVQSGVSGLLGPLGL